MVSTRRYMEGIVTATMVGRLEGRPSPIVGVIVSIPVLVLVWVWVVTEVLSIPTAVSVIVGIVCERRCHTSSAKKTNKKQGAEKPNESLTVKLFHGFKIDSVHHESIIGEIKHFSNGGFPQLR